MLFFLRFLLLLIVVFYFLRFSPRWTDVWWRGTFGGRGFLFRGGVATEACFVLELDESEATYLVRERHC